MKKIFIIIVNYHGEKDTRELLESLKNVYHVDFEFEVVVINNDFRRGGEYREGRETLPYGLKIINNEKNVGFAKANNQGIEYAMKNNADYICLLNNDTIVDPCFITELMKTAENNPHAGIISPKIYFYAGHEFHRERYQEEDRGKVIWYAGGVFDWKNVYGSHRGVDEIDAGQYDKLQVTDFATGCCFFIKQEVVMKIGRLDEKYFAYLEDVDYCVRAKRFGYEIYYQPQAVIWHKNASSSGGPGSKLHFFLQERNRLIFGFRYGAVRTKIHLFLKLMQYLFSSNYKIALSAIKNMI